jgi:hypothetical protein
MAQIVREVVLDAVWLISTAPMPMPPSGVRSDGCGTAINDLNGRNMFDLAVPPDLARRCAIYLQERFRWFSIGLKLPEGSPRGDLLKRIDVHPGENSVILTGADHIGP